jgi:hypothetical protein
MAMKTSIEIDAGTRMAMKTSIEIDAGTRTFASGLLPELIAALRRCRPGDLLTVIGRRALGLERVRRPTANKMPSLKRRLSTRGQRPKMMGCPDR